MVLLLAQPLSIELLNVWAREELLTFSFLKTVLVFV